MRPALAVAALALLSTAALPAAPAGPGPAAPVDGLRAFVAEGLGGDLGRPGEVTTFGADGPVTVAATAAEVLDALEAALPGARADHATAAGLVGVGVKDAALRTALRWTPCPEAYLVVAAWGDTFSYLRHAVPSPADPLLPAPATCDAGWGSAGAKRQWSDITLDLGRWAPSQRSTCAAAMMMLDPAAASPPAPGGRCGWTEACFAGQATLTLVRLWGVTLVYVLGGTGHFVVGDGSGGAEQCAPAGP